MKPAAPASPSRAEQINALCAKARQKANSLTDTQREALLEQSMRVIYGASSAPKHARRSR
jgi:hypothetical protein